jgi:hypothetical protein
MNLVEIATGKSFNIENELSKWVIYEDKLLKTRVFENNVSNEFRHTRLIYCDMEGIFRNVLNDDLMANDECGNSYYIDKKYWRLEK